MISKATQQLLEKLFRVQNSYQPAPAITAELAAKTLVMVVGATCVGKNTVMRAAAEADSRFGISGDFTSRPPREGDDPAVYRYYENSDEGIAPLLQRIAERQVVQYAVNPFSRFLYGTELSDYGYTYTLKDVFSTAVAGFRQLGFARTITVTIVSQPDVWLQRFNERFPSGHTQREARRDEAIESFHWSLAQPETEHFWIENSDGQAATAAVELTAICLGTSSGQPDTKALAVACLAAARSIQP